MSFSDFPLREELQAGIAALNFHEPTPIQKEAIPVALQGSDILASAQTGTGKTLGFLLPVMNRMLQRNEPGITALVLAPTRELAAQVSSVAKDVGKFAHIKTALLVGGESFSMQLQAIKGGASLIIATPGRLLDHAERRTIRLDTVHTLVLDEADRMLDMGFAPAIHAILRRLKEERQTLLFSATLPAEIARLSHLALKNPTRIEMAPVGSTADTVTQLLYPVMPYQKNDLLLAILRTISMNSVLIFTRTKRGADQLAHFLRAEDLAVIAMHADLTQAERNQALAGFKTGKFKIMVATDIAARGLDIKRISHVINYEVPERTEDYVHRIGRTGRHFEVGDALTLCSPHEERYTAAIESFIGRKLPRVELPDFPYSRPPAMKPKGLMERLASGRRRRFIPRGRSSRFR
jgi:ATP-dependent RNA helicase RhlE